MIKNNLFTNNIKANNFTMSLITNWMLYQSCFLLIGSGNFLTLTLYKN